MYETRQALGIIPITKEFIIEHFDAIKECSKDLKWDTWQEEHFLLELPRKFELSGAFLNEEQIIGIALISERGPIAYLHRFIIHPDFRGQGFAKKFWSSMCDNLRCEGYQELYWKVHEDNLQAVAFYDKMGSKTKRKSVDGYLLKICQL